MKYVDLYPFPLSWVVRRLTEQHELFVDDGELQASAVIKLINAAAVSAHNTIILENSRCLRLSGVVL